MKEKMKNNIFEAQSEEFYLEPSTLADGITELKGYCKFCDLPIEEGSGFCDSTCELLYSTNTRRMTRGDWQELASRDKSILIGY